MGYSEFDYIPSELSPRRAVDIHHIDCRGMGGSKSKDRIEELIALTREEHIKYGDKKKYMAFLYIKHLRFLKKRGISNFNEEYINEKIKKYQDEK